MTCRPILLALIAVSTVATGQDAKPAEPAKPDDTYAKATKDFTSVDGVFKVWRKDEGVLFEIPKATLGRDFLWVTELSATPAGSYAGSAVAEGVVRWEERGDKVLLRKIQYRVRASGGGNIVRAVEDSNVNPILKSFKIEGRAPSGDPLIDVGAFLKGDIAEFSAKGSFGGGPLDSSRTFLDRVVVLPENINVHILATFGQGGGGASASPFGGVAAQSSNTGMVHHSMVLLPAEPMRPRMGDSRVGYFSVGVDDYGTPSNGVKSYELITRYRLEKKNPSAKLSEPIKPIVYYISREVPEKWRKACKQGIEDWQPAFETAGFKNAIIALDAPDDPNWSPEDARFSVIRWAPLPIANAMGPHVNDPRSGEIVSAHVIMWHNILELQAAWYFSQASAQDKRAQKLPLSDDLMSDLLRFVVAHEVGHTLGLPHNGKSSAMVATEKLRDPKWTKENGTCTSIMDYARFNYVAQPGDGAALIPQVGRYDKFSIMWGYTPIPEATTMWDETKTLDAWASRQIDDPELRFYDNFSSSDPTAQSEALGDDAVTASDYGVANLKRSMGFLLPATVKLGEDYSETDRFWGSLIGQFGNYIGHVSAVVGGVVQTDYRGGRGGAVYEPTPRAYQARSVKWICDNVLATPSWLTPEDLVWRIGQDGGLSRIVGLQRRALSGLLNGGRLARMQSNAVRQGSAAYSIDEMLETVRAEVFREYAGSSPRVDPARRALQRAYVDTLAQRLTAADLSRGIARTELETTLALLKLRASTITDGPTRTHARDLVAWGEFVLANPDKGSAAVPAAAFNPFGVTPDENGHIGGCSLGGTVHDASVGG